MYKIKALAAACMLTMPPMLFCAYVLVSDIYATVGQPAPLKEALTAGWIALIAGVTGGVFALTEGDKILRGLLATILIIGILSGLAGWLIYQL